VGRYQSVGQLIGCAQSDDTRRYQRLDMSEILNQLENASKNQKNADAAKAADDLGFEIVTRDRELIKLPELHERREYRHQQQQDQYDLIDPAEHFGFSAIHLAKNSNGMVSS